MTNPSTPSNWLDDLDTLPDLRESPKAPKSKKPKKIKRLAGETHEFKPISLAQFNQTQPQCQRGFGGDLTLPVFRQFFQRNLKKATYAPSHILGISPYWPEHNQINWRLS